MFPCTLFFHLGCLVQERNSSNKMCENGFFCDSWLHHFKVHIKTKYNKYRDFDFFLTNMSQCLKQFLPRYRGSKMFVE